MFARLAFAAWAILALVCADTCTDSFVDAKSTLFSIPDIHGDFAGLLSFFVENDLVSADGTEWTGNDAVVVQTGDVVDRGNESAQAYRFLFEMNRQAEPQGGRVVCLLGNHEVMNLRGDFRFATAEETVGFGGDRVRAFSEQGEFGSKIRSLPTAVVVRHHARRTLFVHAGLVSEFAADGIDALNDRVRASLIDFNDSVLEERGPLWNRFLTLGTNEVAVCDELTKTLETIGADEMVVGHTVRPSGVYGTRCDDRLVMGDVGFSPYYGGVRTGLRHLRDGRVEIARSFF